MGKEKRIEEETVQALRNLISGGIYPNAQWIQVTTLMNKLGELETHRYSEEWHEALIDRNAELETKVDELEATISSMTAAGASNLTAMGAVAKENKNCLTAKKWNEKLVEMLNLFTEYADGDGWLKDDFHMNDIEDIISAFCIKGEEK